MSYYGGFDRRHISRMMRTSSTLYRAGSKHLLKDGVLLSEERQLRSFCRFMLAEKQTRFRYLRQLTLIMDRPSQAVAKKFVYVLKRMAHLESLHLSADDEFLNGHPDLCDAISGLASLRRLHADDAGKLACDMLKRSCSKLVSLYLNFGMVPSFPGDRYGEFFYNTLDPEDLPDYHPVSVLAAFAPTLEELIVEYEGNVRLPHQPHAVYPRLRKLHLKDDYPFLRPYIDAFPNLTHITLHTSHCELSVPYEDHEEVFWEIRSRNEGDQLVNGSWQHLEEYRGPVLELYLLGLTCPVPHLYFPRIADQDLEFLPDVVDSARPVELRMNIRGDPFGDTEDELPAVLRRPGCSFLRKLVLRVEIPPEYEESDIQISMDNLLPSLQTLALHHFELTLEPNRLLNPTPRRGRPRLTLPDGSLEPPITPAPLFPVEHSLEEFNPLDYAQRVFEAVPFMKEALVVVGGPRAAARRVTRLERGEGEATVATNHTEIMDYAPWASD
ncbi:hypothetical protein BD310DRAFT_972399 [Dichomitus squalens]|uniref:F-box domain-containing protein n=1 Tax=Dichomitus squalens TaxID=114155 RepID=A0A4Q9QC73_9APHY|nr:hypothetical protein BD310DRAFT_972399 [Dichomitus squalens]